MFSNSSGVTKVIKRPLINPAFLSFAIYLCFINSCLNLYEDHCIFILSLPLFVESISIWNCHCARCGRGGGGRGLTVTAMMCCCFEFTQTETSKKYCTYRHSAQMLFFKNVADYKVNFFIWSNFPLPLTPLYLFCWSLEQTIGLWLHLLMIAFTVRPLPPPPSHHLQYST